MKSTAAGLAALGRGPDTMLIHMSPREVAGLQQLAMAHGGSLTTNPHTGLPEAGILETVLPLALGFALGPAGFALMSAPMAGLAVGGLQALRTGDLGKGLMAGLGAYGGAGLGGAAEASGALEGIGLKSPSIADAGFNALPTEAPSMLGANIGTSPGIPGGYLTDGLASNPDALSAVSGYGQGVGNLQPQPMGLPPSEAAPKPSFMQALGQQFPTGMNKAAAGIGALGALGGFEQPRLGFAAPQQQTSTAKLSGPIRRPYDPERNLYTDYGILQPTYAAKGGEMHSVPQLEDGGFVLTKKAVDGMGKGSNDRGQRAAAAGLGAIPIKGPGTGTSDSIPTSIDGVRPAKVSNGEAYVPQKRVKQAGGAKKLYALMRKAENDARRRAA